MTTFEEFRTREKEGIDLSGKKKWENPENCRICEISTLYFFCCFHCHSTESSSNIITKLSANKKAIQFVVQYIKRWEWETEDDGGKFLSRTSTLWRTQPQAATAIASTSQDWLEKNPTRAKGEKNLNFHRFRLENNFSPLKHPQNRNGLSRNLFLWRSHTRVFFSANFGGCCCGNQFVVDSPSRPVDIWTFCWLFCAALLENLLNQQVNGGTFDAAFAVNFMIFHRIETSFVCSRLFLFPIRKRHLCQ